MLDDKRLNLAKSKNVKVDIKIKNRIITRYCFATFKATALVADDEVRTTFTFASGMSISRCEKPTSTAKLLIKPSMHWGVRTSPADAQQDENIAQTNIGQITTVEDAAATQACDSDMDVDTGSQKRKSSAPSPQAAAKPRTELSQAHRSSYFNAIELRRCGGAGDCVY